MCLSTFRTTLSSNLHPHPPPPPPPPPPAPHPSGGRSVGAEAESEETVSPPLSVGVPRGPASFRSIHEKNPPAAWTGQALVPNSPTALLGRWTAAAETFSKTLNPTTSAAQMLFPN
ncbi:unnamed protein product [Gadus morhua 'NCC']